MPEPHRYEKIHLPALPGLECPCGETRRAFVNSAGAAASMHLVHIRHDSQVHYHRKTTEIYYILSGSGWLELDGDRIPAAQGDAILICPGCRHRACAEGGD